MPKRTKAKKHHYRCRACSSPIPVGYSICGSCGSDQAAIVIRVNTLEELTREYHRACNGR